MHDNTRWLQLPSLSHACRSISEDSYVAVQSLLCHSPLPSSRVFKQRAQLLTFAILIVLALQKIYDGKTNVVPEVWEVLDKIKGFTNKVSLVHASFTF